MAIFEIEGPGGVYEVDAPDQGQAVAAFKKMNTPAEQPSMAGDIAKSAGIGLVKGGAMLAGIPGDVQNLLRMGLNKGIGYGASKLGYDVPEAIPAPRQGAPGAYPTSGQVIGGIENLTGPLYKPKTTAGEYAQTVGEFLPASLAGPAGHGGRLANALKFGVAPAVTSESAGQLTKGTAAEPYARFAGGIAGALPSLLSRPKISGVPTAEELKTQSGIAYKAAEDAGVIIAPASTMGAVKDIMTEISTKAGYHPKLHPKTTAALESLAQAAEQPLTLQSAEVQRRILREAAKDPAERAVASRVISKLDNFIETLPPKALVAGDAFTAIPQLKSAREMWSRQKKSETITDIIDTAKLNTGNLTQSGMENALRRGFRQLAKDKDAMKAFSPAEQKAIRDVAIGSAGENAIRLISKMAPRGVVSGGFAIGLGAATGNPLVSAAAMLAGEGAKAVSTKMTRNRANLADEIMRAGVGKSSQVLEAQQRDKLARLVSMLQAREPTNQPLQITVHPKR